MLGTRWRLLRFAGIPINVDASWLIIFALLNWTLADVFRQQEIEGLRSVHYWLMAFISSVAFFACIVLHELGHALVARRLGMQIRGITLFMFGGVAELESEPESPRDEFLMAIGGPVVSAILGGLFIGLNLLGSQAGWHAAWLLILQYLAGINIMVLLFNLVPAFPLDGGRVLRALLWAICMNLRRATYWASLSGRVFAWLLIAGGIILLFNSNFPTGLWLILIGLFLNNLALGGYQQVVVRQALQGEPIRKFMNPEPIVVPTNIDLRSWVDDFVYRYHRKTFPVADNGHLEGFVTTRALAAYPREEWEKHTVGEVMRRDLAAISVGPNTDALQALRRMQRTGSSRLLVTEGERLVGIVSLKDLLRFLQLKIELEGEDENGAGNLPSPSDQQPSTK